MSRKFSLWKDPHDNGYNLYKKTTISIKKGVTILVGCNGIGKTTLLSNIESRLKKNNIPVLFFDNLSQGGSNARSESCYLGDFSFLAASMCSSEGENIVLNLSRLAKKLKYFIDTGKTDEKKDRMVEAFRNAISENNEKNAEEEISNERWLLLDATDSGLSVDNIIDLKEGLFKTILEYSGDKDIYIVVSANEYEMANGENCFDVYNGKYIKFNNYEEYKNMILDSRKNKEEREKNK